METCSVCLCTHRSLQPLRYLQDTFNLIIQRAHANLPEVALCFECFHILKKCDLFKRKAELALQIFLDHSQDGNFESISNEVTFSSFTITKKNEYDYIFIEDESGEDVQTISINEFGTQAGTQWNYVIINNELVIEEPSTSRENKEGDLNDMCIDTNETKEQCTQQLINFDGIKVTNSSLNDSPKNKNTLKVRTTKTKEVYSPFANRKSRIEQKEIELEDPRETKAEQDIETRIEFTTPKFSIVIEDDVTVKDNTEMRPDKRRPTNRFGPLNKLINFTDARNAEDVPSRDEIYSQFSRVLTKPFSDDVEVKVMNDEELKIHRRSIRRDHNYVNSPYKCAKCIVGYNTDKELNDHNKAKHVPVSKNTIKCPVCYCYVSPMLYKVHYARHFVIYVCLRCDFATEEVVTARHHHRWLHESTRALHSAPRVSSMAS